MQEGWKSGFQLLIALVQNVLAIGHTSEIRLMIICPFAVIAHATSITLGTKVKTIAPNAFAGTNIKTITVKTKKLTKKSVKNALKGSKVSTVKVQIKALKSTKGLKGKALKKAKQYNTNAKKLNKQYVKKYKKIFTKKICGKKAKVK